MEQVSSDLLAKEWRRRRDPRSLFIGLGAACVKLYFCPAHLNLMKLENIGIGTWWVLNISIKNRRIIFKSSYLIQNFLWNRLGKIPQQWFLRIAVLQIKHSPQAKKYHQTITILLKSIESKETWKCFLNDFALATGLSFNFSKTNLCPLHVDQQNSTTIANIPDCTTSSFLQIYLGLPLSLARLPLNGFLPILERCRKFLAGWRAKLLSIGNRLILLTVVINSLWT